jgi:hypothetical protein
VETPVCWLLSQSTHNDVEVEHDEPINLWSDGGSSQHNAHKEGITLREAAAVFGVPGDQFDVWVLPGNMVHPDEEE